MIRAVASLSRWFCLSIVLGRTIGKAVEGVGALNENRALHLVTGVARQTAFLEDIGTVVRTRYDVIWSGV